MAILKKTLFDEKLETINVLVNDTDPNSRYFKITELPDTFTGGKNAFLIQGSTELVPDTIIKIQIKDAKGDTIYYEPGEGSVSSSLNGESFIGEYYEGTSKVVAVYIYPDTAYGPATITILGELSEYETNGVRVPVPENWKDTYNVKWEKQINVNPTLANTTKIRFYKRPTVSITEELEPIYRIEDGVKVNSGISQSFANVNVSNIDTFAGDVKRVKVYRTSQGNISDYDLIQDILVESKELLTSYELSGSVIGNAGFMTSEVLNKLWNYPQLTATLDSTRIDNGVKLSPLGLNMGNFTFTSSLNLSQNSVYEFGIDAFFSGSDPMDMNVYVSGSNNGEVLVGTLNGVTPTKNLEDTIFQFQLTNPEPTASLYLGFDGYLTSSFQQWHIGNLSLKLSQDTAFSPDSISFITAMPTVIGNETYNFKFEFYDINNNYVPVAVTASATFTGGNDNIAGAIAFISASSSASFDALYAVSASISGTITTNSSSVSGSITSLSSSVSGSIGVVSGSLYTLSGSVSGSITSLSSSISTSFSASTYFALSQSNYTFNLATDELQKLADGNYSGSFIGETTIYSPAIGGQNGYISGVFKVGQDGITLDGPNRAMYVGTGMYNNSNTPFYFKSGSSNIFSLADKLSWDGTTLTVNGTINVTGGNAATQTFVNTVGSNAAASASLSASAAFSSSKAIADSIANGTYSGGTLISNNSVISPIIAGNLGYFSGKVTVGNTNPITLDATTSTRRIYVGSGNYNNSDTAVYLDGDGKFSLKDKLYFDGATLNVSGTISGSNIIGGTLFGNNIVGGAISIGDGFTVNEQGHLTATGADINGTITADNGTVGGFVLTSTQMIGSGSLLILDASLPQIEFYTASNASAKIVLNSLDAFTDFTTQQLYISGASYIGTDGNRTAYAGLTQESSSVSVMYSGSFGISVSESVAPGTPTNVKVGINAFRVIVPTTSLTQTAGTISAVSSPPPYTAVPGQVYYSQFATPRTSRLYWILDVYDEAGTTLIDTHYIAQTVRVGAYSYTYYVGTTDSRGMRYWLGPYTQSFSATYEGDVGGVAIKNIPITTEAKYKARLRLEVIAGSGKIVNYVTNTETYYDNTATSYHGNSYAIPIDDFTISQDINKTEITGKGIQVASSQTAYTRITRRDSSNIDDGTQLFENVGSIAYFEAYGADYTEQINNEAIIAQGKGYIYGNATIGSYGYSLNNKIILQVGGNNTNETSSFGTNVYPGASGTFNLGSSVYKWKDIWATNGAIQTSDINKKTEIVSSNLGLDFINKLNPVSYKFITGSVVYEDGPEFNREVKEIIPGKRTHYGLIAQEVKEAIEDSGISTDDFAGYIIGNLEENTELGLRYDEFIAPMIKAIQELSNKVNQLEEIISGSV